MQAPHETYLRLNTSVWPSSNYLQWPLYGECVYFRSGHPGMVPYSRRSFKGRTALGVQISLFGAKDVEESAGGVCYRRGFSGNRLTCKKSDSVIRKISRDNSFQHRKTKYRKSSELCLPKAWRLRRPCLRDNYPFVVLSNIQICETLVVFIFYIIYKFSWTGFSRQSDNCTDVRNNPNLCNIVIDGP